MSDNFAFDFPYERTLNTIDRAWLSNYAKAEFYANANHFLALGATPETFQDIQRDIWRNKKAYERRQEKKDGMGKNNFVVLSLVQSEARLTRTSPEAVHDLLRVIERRKSKRVMFAGYGTALYLEVGMTVQLCIEGHKMQRKHGRIVGVRRDEWYVEFQTKHGTMNGYFKANELSNI